MYLLLGYGKSNRSIEKYLIKNKIKYIIYDDKLFNNEIDIKKISLVIKSNGINNNHSLLKQIKQNNDEINIISDLQYFYNMNNNKNYCLVTGSNGKTTVVSLLEKCLNNTIAIGNNCKPFFDYIDNEKYKVLEVSSFMLENITKISYKYNVITNIYPTHLEHHLTFINYIKAKLSFLKYLHTDDYVIYNYDDKILRAVINKYDVKKVSVSLNDKKCDLYYFNNKIYFHNTIIINNIENIQLIGEHNIYNIMLVLGVILNHNLKKKNYLEEIYQYQGEKYRMQLIYNNNYRIINDSKSTNFQALNVALNSIDNNIVLIVGGERRKDNYELLKKNLYKINRVYCYGENRNEFNEFFKNNNIKTYIYDSLEEVIKNIIINNNETLLFSPASISHDQFSDFEERGKVFNDLVNKYLINIEKK